ncbi:hypothetical protein GGQ54_002814 [Naumannella cuiyingiana]|uniref:DUF2993 domain-containing protein n=1 Tax=Naumannella cuiyingiana TaxID=1347891 RepID=A0A7Z0DAY3_9ACTN|nr:DUF2993 domain-containing protein [Naumannella cuiyingiana]NYI72254.1 hypothetical protein [Naumannella cuiyingiana]
MRRALAVVVSLLVIAGLLVGADRGAVWLVERQQAEQIAADFRVTPPPRVSFAGVPFLTQLAAGRFERVDVSAAEFTVPDGERTLTLRRVELALTDVRGIEAPVVSRLDGSGTLDWAGVGALVGQPVSYAEPGRIRVDYRAEVFGASVTARVTGTPQLDVATQRLTLADPAVAVADYELPSGVARQLIERLAGPIPLQLPMGLRAERLQAGPDGLAVVVSGTDVPLTPPA